MAKLIPFLAARMGSNELVSKNILFPTHKPWWWSTGVEQEVETHPDCKMAAATAHLPL